LFAKVSPWICKFAISSKKSQPEVPKRAIYQYRSGQRITNWYGTYHTYVPVLVRYRLPRRYSKIHTTYSSSLHILPNYYVVVVGLFFEQSTIAAQTYSSATHSVATRDSIGHSLVRAACTNWVFRYIISVLLCMSFFAYLMVFTRFHISLTLGTVISTPLNPLQHQFSILCCHHLHLQM
jgi:hypothetical protein